jgi:hypothetical protein
VIPSPELDRIDRELLGEFVHPRFEREVPLGRSVSSVGPGHRKVGVDCLPEEVRVAGLVVQRKGLRSCVGKHGQTVRAVRARVRQRLHLNRVKPSVLHRSELHSDSHRMARPRGDEFLGPSEFEKRRPTGSKRHQARDIFKKNLLLGPKPAADSRLDDSNPMQRKVEGLRDDSPHVERNLRARPEHESFVGVQIGEHNVGLDRCVLRVLRLAHDFDDRVGGLEALRNVAHVDVDVGNDVPRRVVNSGRILFVVHDGGPIAEGIVHRENRRQFFVLDADSFQCLEGDLLRCGGHGRDAVTDEPDLRVKHPRVVRGWLGVPLAGGGVPSYRRVLVCQHTGDAAECRRFGRVDLDDPCVSVRASEDLDVECIREQQVGHEPGPRGDQPDAVNLPFVLPDDRESSLPRPSHRHRSSSAPPRSGSPGPAWRSRCSDTGSPRSPL